MLSQAFASERTEEGICILGAALVRAGGDPVAVEQVLALRERNTVMTFGGWREPGTEALSVRYKLGLGKNREILRQKLQAGEEEREDILALAALRHPEDFALLVSVRERLGRRGDHAAITGLGLHGDPRALPILKALLFATDVDPGRGFAQRRLSAVALGRVGLREALPWLERALRYEALDFEGRPGAGLGIQYPVRTDLLWAIGEIADPASVKTLLGYLGNIHGSALGGFYLAAMAALVKIGPLALPALEAFVWEAPEVAAANAVGVMGAIGGSVAAFIQDRRKLVAETAALLVEKS
jgi:hypothetical protein